MRAQIVFKIKKLIFGIICCFIFIILFSSCGDNPVTTTQTNNSNSPAATEFGTPNGTPVTISIGPAGGSIMSADNSLKLEIPAGALSSSTDITIQPVTNFCYNGLGNAYRLSPDGLQFSQPVTLKFLYADSTLSGTLGMLMGIGHQDAAGYWKYFKNITNDTVNRVISIQINQFGLSHDNMTGGGDLSFFNLTRLMPGYTNLIVNGNLTLRVIEVDLHEQDNNGGDILPPLPHSVSSWNVSSGTILSHQNQEALYQAPSQVPAQNPVTVTAVINTQINYGGHVITNPALTAKVNIISGTRTFDVAIRLSGEFYWMVPYHHTYTDLAELVVNINNGAVSVSDTVNHAPNCNPASGHFPNGTGNITWVPDAVGMMDIISGSGNITMQDHVHIGLTHSLRIVVPKWHIVPDQGEPYDMGGGPTSPYPTGFDFINSTEPQNFTIDNGIVSVHFSITPRN